MVCKSQPAAVSTFEGVLFPHFQTILQQDVQEFTPYVFQVGPDDVFPVSPLDSPSVQGTAQWRTGRLGRVAMNVGYSAGLLLYCACLSYFC